MRPADRPGAGPRDADAIIAARIDGTAPPPGPAATAESAQTEAIRDDIEQTRAEMSGTIDAIQDRLDPDRLKEQARAQVREQVQGAKDAVRDATIGRAEDMARNVGDTATEARYTLVETIKQNPLPAALVGIGLGWLWMNRRTPPPARYYAPGTAGYQDWGAYGGRARLYQRDQVTPVDRARDKAGRVGDAASDMATQVQDTAGRLADQAGETASNLADRAQATAGDLSDQAQETMGNLAGGAQYQAQRLEDRFQRAMRENPLAVGAAALALGAAVGLAVPETRREDQLMGEARDTVVEKAQTAAQDTMQKVQGVAEEAGRAAQQAARDQGLTQSS